MPNDILNDKGLLDLLLKNNLAHDSDIVKINQLVTEKGLSIYTGILEYGLLEEDDLGRLIADSLKFPYIDLSHTEISDDILNIIPHIYAKKHSIIAFRVDKEGLHVATLNPNDEVVKKQVEKKAGVPVIAHFATVRGIHTALGHYEKGVVAAFDEIIGKYVKETEKEKDVDPPVVKIVDTIIEYAFRNKASDIHIETQDNNTIVRFRLDGILHDIVTLPGVLHPNMVTRIKVMSNLRTDDHAAPQDGKISFDVEGANLDLRVSTIPTIEGEKVVIRLLFRDAGNLNLSDLGFSDSDLEKVVKAYKRPFGMILATGPTGSGKTTTMYAIIRILNKREVNISTIEDPVEYDLTGINQIQVNRKTDLTFANGLRSLLRQDPDIVLVGEIRDEETAHIAVNASMTGHLVLSTLHTNDSATAVVRFMEMNVEPFMIASTMNLVIAQRLVRKICTACRYSKETTIKELQLKYPSASDIIEDQYKGKIKIRLYEGKGCHACHDTGYTGRIGVYEVLSVDEEIRDAIIQRKTTSDIKNMAIKKGMTTMLDDGIRKVHDGMTTIAEVIRVLSE